MRILIPLLAMVCLVRPALWADNRLDRYYSVGFQAWSQGNYQKARNQWYRFLALSSQNRIPRDPEREEKVRFFFSGLDKGILPIPKKEKSPPLVKKKTVPIRAEEYPSLRDKKVKDLLFKARLAQRQGHLEESKNLFRMALELDPQRKDVRKEWAALKKETSGN